MKFSSPALPSSLYKNPPAYAMPPFENLVEKLAIGHDVKEFDDLLKDLQANILLYHRRNFSRFCFIHFKDGEEYLREAIKWIEGISKHVTPAKDQFADRSKPVCCFYLTWEGYRRLKLTHLAPPLENNEAFTKGMRNRVAFDFDKNDYDGKLHPMVEGERGSIHAMLMIASDKPDFSDVDKNVQISKEVGGGNDWAYVTIQDGLIKRRKFEGMVNKTGTDVGKIVEWFGFRDGVSQPLFFPDARTDKEEVKKFDGDSVAPLRAVLVRDKGGQHWYSAGSFLAFLKLEQDVRQFRQNVQTIAKEIPKKDTKNGSEEDVDLAEAYIMGRFHDGTSVSLFSEPKYYKEKLPENDFYYSKVHISNAESNVSDEKAIRCPFAAHARKANPRDDKEAVFIVRRGVLYDDRSQEFSEEKTIWEEVDTPVEGVGLLFMSFQSSLEKQFEHILNNWMLSVNTGTQATGVDMLVGTGFNRQFSKWYLPEEWGGEDADKKRFFTPEEIKPCVHFKGGEYFFAPSISFLENVGKNNLIVKGKEETILSRVVNEVLPTDKKKVVRGGFAMPRIIIKHD